MNAIDGIILLVVLGYGVMGYFRGFLQGFINLFGLGICLVVAWLYYQPAAALLERWLPGALTPAGAFLGLFAVAYVVYSLLARIALKGVPKFVRKSLVNRILGVGPGVLDGLIMCALLLTILLALPGANIPRDAITDSELGGALVDVGTRVQAGAMDVFGGAMRTLIPARIVEPGEKSRIQLPFHTAKGTPDVSLEKQMWGLVNRERLQRGLRPLEWDDRLQEIAREHSQDMLKRGYFSHYSPEGKTVMDRVTARGLRFQVVGENLALAPTLKIAHEGLMESPGHRANILNKEYARVGIGAVVARPYGIMFTQVFASKR
jgi:uncharacterized protein YkwD/uncharacterized membrane protein required for colicin V production